MDMLEKISSEDYVAFFKKTKEVLSDLDRMWIEIKYRCLKEPTISQFGDITATFYCPDNIYVKKGKQFAIPTGFKYVAGDADQAYVKHTSKHPFIIHSSTIEPDRLADHIVLQGVAVDNFCITEGEPLFAIAFNNRRN